MRLAILFCVMTGTLARMWLGGCLSNRFDHFCGGQEIVATTFCLNLHSLKA
ncbi:unnamed protein product [Arabis nemorensis]|uniref:Uncharacterized protein n=1 Tax=Arabis nemorensis TaxID=586526 RepID=A0A565B1R0_9BRAS|nr:unnamed protein product [Arabis nemorensis]